VMMTSSGECRSRTEGLLLFPEFFKLRPGDLRAFMNWILASNPRSRLPVQLPTEIPLNRGRAEKNKSRLCQPRSGR